jgi:adenylate cyclase
MSLRNIDKFITSEAKEAYLTLLKFWVVSLPIFSAVLLLLNFTAEMRKWHTISLFLFIIISFFLVVLVKFLLEKNSNSTKSMLFYYFVGISYPLISPLIVFFITDVFAPDFSIPIMSHTIPSLFLIMTMATAFSFSFRIAIIGGFFSSLLFTICFLWLQFNYADQTDHFEQVLGITYYIEIVLYILVTGLFGGLLANQARRMLIKISETVQEREFVSSVLGEYVSEEVRDKILQEGGLSEEGEEREVTVLFADLRNFTSISEERNPKEIVSFLNQYFDSMVDIIQRNGGVVDKFIGDSVMAYFGAPIAIENPQASAFKAALEMSEELNKINKIFTLNNYPTIKHGIGLHHGEVVLGNIGSKKRKNYTIIGDTVNLASRLESLTKSNQSDLILSRTVYDSLSQFDQNKMTLLKDLEIKGKRDVINCFKLKLE